MLISLQIFLIPFLLGTAAFFAAGESAILSLTAAQWELLKSTKPGTHRRISRLIQPMPAFFSTIIIGNEFINVVISTLIVSLIEYHYTYLGVGAKLLLSVSLSSFLLLVFSEIVPKLFAFRFPMLVASFVAGPLSLAKILLTPMRILFDYISEKILSALGHKSSPSQTRVSEKEFLSLVDVGAASGSLERGEKDLIYNVFDLADLGVSSVMTPWAQVTHLREATPLNEAIQVVRAKGYSRIPVVSRDGNNVAGILYAKELIRYMNKPSESSSVEIVGKHLAAPFIVSRHKKVARLFREFRAKKVHFALVVDEFGNHVGIVTLEDVLRALFKSRTQQLKTA